jgi:acetolactate synthase I/II/III large subunit
MSVVLRGADVLVRSLEAAGVRTVFTLSGNHIMPVFDAVLGRSIDLIHVRHEAAAVHMADAYARLTGEVGVALVTGGQGHTNAVAALTTAQCADSPVLLLSGHAPLNELGRGSFQELRQAEMAAPVCKASSTARASATLGADVARAMQLALSGRPGPVHVSLPVDVLDGTIAEAKAGVLGSSAFRAIVQPLAADVAAAVMEAMKRAKRPLVVAGPMLATASGRAKLTALERACGVPVVVMESPRGINDPGLGAFAEVLAQADLIVFLGKPLDFTLRFGEAPAVADDAQFIVIDPERAMIARVHREKGSRVVLSALADAAAAVDALMVTAGGGAGDAGWRDAVAQAIIHRPPAWRDVAGREGAVHPIELCRAVQSVIDSAPDAIFIADGGEIGQWAQAGIVARRRVINGVAGSIGASIPFAIAARVVEPKAPVVAVMGDGTFGFHMAEFDTAVRHKLPFVAVVGNDSAWNAEHQIQVRAYGAARAHSCELLPGTRYDQVAVALGGHGELVTRAADIEPALGRAIASGKPACVNVMIERLPAPVVRRAK